MFFFFYVHHNLNSSPLTLILCVVITMCSHVVLGCGDVCILDMLVNSGQELEVLY
jgi:hypothetical protein